MAKTFKAKYPGDCPDCDGGIRPGDEVTYSADNKVVHADCTSDGAPESQPTATICSVCHLQEPCGCDYGIATAPTTPAASAARLAKFTQNRPAPTTAPSSFSPTSFFEDQQNPPMAKIMTLEEETENRVERDQYDRPLIVQPDGRKLPYNRASSYGGQIEDKDNIARWQQQQVVRGMAMHPELAQRVPDVAKGDPWAELDSRTKKGLTRVAEQAQEYAGSHLKSTLGTQIHAATEFVDLGDSLEDKFGDLPPERRKLLIERANAYYAKIQDYGLKWDSVETFGVQDELHVAGTWDRRGYVPWWPEHRQTIGDVKTSSSLDFAGIGFSVQLATYAHMCEYVIDTAERIPHDDMNLDWALIVHVDRHQGGPVTLAKVDVGWGWTKARLAREILVARREGRDRVAELDEREALLLTLQTKAELLERQLLISTWPQWLRDLANERYVKLP